MDAPVPSVAPAVRDVLPCQSVHARRCCRQSEDVRKNRQPVAEGQCFLAGAGAGRRIGSRHRSMPIATCATTRRRRGSTRSMARPSCKRSSASRLPMHSPRSRPGKDAAHLALVAQRIDELKERYREGRAARGGDARPALHPHAGGRRRRARLQSPSAHAGRGRKRPDACRRSRSSCASNSSCCCSTSAAPWRQFQPCSPRIPISHRACAGNLQRLIEVVGLRSSEVEGPFGRDRSAFRAPERASSREPLPRRITRARSPGASRMRPGARSTLEALQLDQRDRTEEATQCLVCCAPRI